MTKINATQLLDLVLLPKHKFLASLLQQQ